MKWWRNLTVDQRERRIAALFLAAGLLEVGVGCTTASHFTRSTVLHLVVGFVLLVCAAVSYGRHRANRR